MKIFRPTMAALSAAGLLAAPVTAAAQIKMLGSFETWDAAVIKSRSGTACYTASLPAKKDTKVKRGEVSLMVTHWPGRKRLNLVRVNAGYAFKKDSSVQLRIDKKAYKLFTSRGSAWAKTSKLDATLVKAMKGAATATVVGIAANGTKTVDVYALKGFAKAIAAIDKACGVK